ncbi:MAG: hypothetical protein V1701_02795 [Planctomycetota bacterium]
MNNTEPAEEGMCERCLTQYPSGTKRCPECERLLCPDCYGPVPGICKQCEEKMWE